MSTSPEKRSDRTRHEASPGSAVGPNVTGSVVVGMDGSDCSQHALHWAVNKSALGPVVPVSVYQSPSTFDLVTRSLRSTDPEVYRAAAEAELRAALVAADQGVRQRAAVIEGQPGPCLVEAARNADLLVVGTRGRGGVSATVLGSVSSYCVKNTTVPVVVIPPDWPVDEALETIVVGVDGSENADAALQWAVDHVAPGGTVVAAGAGSVYGYMSGEFEPAPALLGQQIRELVEKAVSRMSLPSEAAPEIVTRVDAADARVALPRIASNVGADLLVLGARGTTGIAFLLLGSVSSALVHHPTLPTVIVPGQDRSTGNG